MKSSNLVALIFVDLVGLGWALFKVEDLSHTAEGFSPHLSFSSLPLCLPHLTFHTCHIMWFLIYQVYLERILRKPEIDAFAEELKPHQVIKVCVVSSYFWLPWWVCLSFFFSTESPSSRQFHCAGPSYDWA